MRRHRQRLEDRRRLILMALALATIVVLALAPLVLSIAARRLGALLGCTIGPANPPPCLLGSVDLAPFLDGLHAFGFMVILSLPLAGIAFCLWLVVLVASLVRRRRLAASQGK